MGEIVIHRLLTIIKTSPFLSKLLMQRTRVQFIKYVLVGSISYCLEFSLLYVIKEWLHLWLIYANSLAYLICAMLNFMMNKFWAFQSAGKASKQLVLYSALVAFNFMASNVMLYLLTINLGIHYLVAKVITTAVIVLWNFVIYKKVIYN